MDGLSTAFLSLVILRMLFLHRFFCANSFHKDFFIPLFVYLFFIADSGDVFASVM